MKAFGISALVSAAVVLIGFVVGRSFELFGLLLFPGMLSLALFGGYDGFGEVNNTAIVASVSWLAWFLLIFGLIFAATPKTTARN